MLGYLYNNHEDETFFTIWNHHKCLNYLFLIHLNTYVMGLRPLEIFSLFQCGERLYTSESVVYRQQILTYKDGPRAERVTVNSQTKRTQRFKQDKVVHHYIGLKKSR